MIKLLLALLLITSYSYAKDAKMELGIGAAVLSYPDYIGSKSTQILVTPIPHIRYRSEYLRIDEEGINSKLFGLDGLRMDLSLNGSLPANSEDNNAREGMPDLDFTGEIGVKFVYNIYEHGVALLEFELPMRAVFSSDFTYIDYQGVLATPLLKYSLKYPDFEWTFRSGLMFADKKYNSYFYEVTEEYATPTREVYSPEGGFTGWRNRIGLTYQKNSLWAGAFVSYINIDHATFRDSPLVETSSALYMGASIAYIFYTED